MTMKSLFAAVSLALLTGIGAGQAATVNGTGAVTNNVIFGSGNTNTAFTGVTVGGLELGLRAKLRYDASSACGGFGCARNLFNYDGSDTYTFLSSQSHVPANRSLFNFEWSINSNANGLGGALNSLTYRIDIDTNPSVAAGRLLSYDPLSSLSTGYYLGTNASPNGGATFRPGGTGNLGTFNLAQNSVNMGFLPGGPLGSGQFTIFLSAFGPGNSLRASTSIKVTVDAPAPVPLPAGLLLLAGGISALGLTRRRIH